MSKEKKRLTVKEFLDHIKELGYTDTSTISFGFFNCDGEWYESEIEEIEDGDRSVGVDDIGIVLKRNEEYTKSVLEESNIELEEDLKNIIARYC